MTDRAISSNTFSLANIDATVLHEGFLVLLFSGHYKLTYLNHASQIILSLEDTLML